MTTEEALRQARNKLDLAIAAGGRNQASAVLAEWSERVSLRLRTPEAVLILSEGIDACDKALACDSESPDVRTWRAILLFRKAEREANDTHRSDILSAVQEIQAVVKDRPDWHPALNAMGYMFIRMAGWNLGHVSYSDAVDKFKVVLSIRPDYQRAMTNWAIARVEEARVTPAVLARSMIDEAIGKCRDALALRPDNHMALAIWADALCRAADAPRCPNKVALLEEAISKYRRSLEIRPDAEIARNGLANTMRLLGREKQGTDRYGLFQAAIKLCNEAIEARQDNAAAFIIQAHAYLDLAERSADSNVEDPLPFAYRAAQRAVEAWGATPNAWAARGRVRQAAAMRAKKRIERQQILVSARRDFEKAESLSWPVNRFHDALAWISLREADLADDNRAIPLYLQAAAEASGALAIRPDWQSTQLHVAAALVGMARRARSIEDAHERLQRAEASCVQALEIDENAAAFRQFGSILLDQSRVMVNAGMSPAQLFDSRKAKTALACEKLEMAARFGEDHPFTYVLLGDARLRLHFFSQSPNHEIFAMMAYRKAIELDPQNASAHLGLGTFHMNRNDLASALDEVRVASSLDPDNEFIACRLSRLEGNARLAQEALESGRFTPMVLATLGDLLFASAQRDRNSDNLQQALAKYRESLELQRSARTAEQLIRALIWGRATGFIGKLDLENVRESIDQEPDAFGAQTALAELLIQGCEGDAEVHYDAMRGQIAEAVARLSSAVQVRPRSVPPDLYRRAVECSPSDEELWHSWRSLLDTMAQSVQKESIETAEKQFKEAAARHGRVTTDPEDTPPTSFGSQPV